ncbi:MAG: recombination protein RecR [Kiritimatiellaeota bacterium]|nr:recombination protein RecR [Kiritimatiellota bacterium]
MQSSSSYPEAVEQLIAGFRRLPGVGARTAERLALAVLRWTPEELHDFGLLLATLPERVGECRVCGNLAEDDLCPVCRDPARDQSIICVVENADQVPVIERSGGHRGLYHVLGGRIVPLDGIGPEDLRIGELRARLDSGEVRELVLATGSDIEGEATATYLARELRRPGLAITRIATGIPVGADLAFADSATLATALNSRRPVG